MKGRFGSSLDHLAAFEYEYLFAPTESAEIKTAMAHNSTETSADADNTKKRPTPTEKVSEGSIQKKSKTDEGVHVVDSSEVEDDSCPPGSGERIGYGWRRILKEKDAQESAVQEKIDEDLTQTHELVVRCPLGVASFKDGVHRCDIDGKPALSTFRY